MYTFPPHVQFLYTNLLDVQILYTIPVSVRHSPSCTDLYTYPVSVHHPPSCTDLVHYTPEVQIMYSTSLHPVQLLYRPRVTRRTSMMTKRPCTYTPGQGDCSVQLLDPQSLSLFLRIIPGGESRGPRFRLLWAVVSAVLLRHPFFFYGSKTCSSFSREHRCSSHP